MAGEDGMFCNVSIALSDNDGLDFLPNSCSPNSPPASTSRTNSSSSLASSRPIGSSRRTEVDGFLKRVSWLAFRGGVWF